MRDYLPSVLVRGLRDYGLPPTIWDGAVGCEHEWGEGLPPIIQGQVEQTKKTAEAAGKGQTASTGQFCLAGEKARISRNKAIAFYDFSLIWAREALRVLKPGGHLLSFGGTRTSHRLASALEDAGFEIRGTLMWAYASGFPKSFAIPKAIDKAAGAGRPGGVAAAAAWAGWGTALKPSHEPIILARKPLGEPNVAANVLRFGVGGLNVDACRVPPAGAGQEGRDPSEPSAARRYAEHGGTDFAALPGPRGGSPDGRWPPTFLLSHAPCCRLLGTKRVKPLEGMEEVEAWACIPGCPVAALDAQSGDLQSGSGPNFIRKTAAGYRGNTYGAHSRPEGAPNVVYGDLGGASRFFPRFAWEAADFVPFLYCAKADRAERNVGNVENLHPTVKPLALMQWLCRLVTPPKTPDGKPGLVLDPFCGSGSTIIAALREGFRCVGIDREQEYCEIAKTRVVGDAPLLNTLAVET